MQEWMIAMLVISIMLIIRDMAKTILAENLPDTEELPSLQEGHPQKERVEKYAASFQKLADTFYGMPYRKDYLSSRQVEQIIEDTNAKVCSRCYQREICWGEHSQELVKGVEALVRSMESGNEENVRGIRADWTGICPRSVQYYETVAENFQKERQNLMWDNRMIENRLAVAQQLMEVSHIMENVASDLYDLERVTPQFEEELRKGLLLSKYCEISMVPVNGSRCIVNGEYHTVHFAEDVSYQVLYGTARLTREEEKVSGDNYICRQEDGGRFVMCLSDGMGSGMEACRESETVVELLEQFMESGFSQETAAKMVNSALVLKGEEGMFSTVDICAVDLYTGICNFLKAGAASTFIKRDHWVESITSESLAAGLVQQIDFETATRKLYHGDYLIMMTDGVLDALPDQKEEETMKEIIMDVHEESPKDFGRGILERVLGYSDYHARDDMTVLVAGVWKK